MAPYEIRRMASSARRTWVRDLPQEQLTELATKAASLDTEETIYISQGVFRDESGSEGHMSDVMTARSLHSLLHAARFIGTSLAPPCQVDRPCTPCEQDIESQSIRTGSYWNDPPIMKG